jgi:hypothetical protein
MDYYCSVTAFMFFGSSHQEVREVIDKSHIGHEFPPHSAVVEAGRLRFFAQAVGNTDPVYLDESAGYRGWPPPSCLFCLNNEKPNPLQWIDELGLDLGRILRGQLLVFFDQ